MLLATLYGPPPSFVTFLADRTNGRAYATVLRLSVVCRLSSSVCDVMYCG